MKIQGVLDSLFRDPLPILIAILTGCYILTTKSCPCTSFNMEVVSTSKLFVCKIPLLARALGLAAAKPSARATIGYLAYNKNFQTSWCQT